MSLYSKHIIGAGLAQLKRMLFGFVSGDQSSPAEGEFWWNSVTHKLKWYNGTSIIDPLDIANHTGTIATAQIANDAVDNTKLANVATATFKGRTTAGTGDPEDLTVAQAKTLLNLTGTNSGDQTVTLTGDVTGSGTGSFATAIAAGVIVDADINAAANISTSKINGFDTQVRTSTLNQMTAPTADLSINTHKLTNVVDPVGPQDVGTKNYIDTAINVAIEGRSPKPAVRAVSTVNVTLASAVENGDAFGGVTLATTDRVLLVGQTAHQEDGIYTVNASGAPTRALDANTTAELKGASVFVTDGTGAATEWVQTATVTTVGTTPQAWVQNGANVTYTASNGVLLTGNNFTAVPDPSGNLTVGASGLAANTANANLALVRKYAQGSTAGTTSTVTHNLGSAFTTVQIYDATSGETVEADVVRTSVNVVTVTFLAAVTAGQYTIVVMG